ncbi:MAG: hypothetical protein IJ935_17070, partial [Afipia sp.]|nr:hypothetical protein [Afipia sp.]
LFNAIVGPAYYRHRTLPFDIAPAIFDAASRLQTVQNPCRQNPLALAGCMKSDRAFTPYRRQSRIRTAARDVVPNDKNATICRDSRARVGHGASTCSGQKANKFDLRATLQIAAFLPCAGGFDAGTAPKTPEYASVAAINRLSHGLKKGSRGLTQQGPPIE